MSARVISILLGIIFIAVGALGFRPELLPPVGGQAILGYDNAIFAVNAAHNIVHLATGVVLLILPFIIGGRATLLLAGLIYAAVAVLGFMMAPGETELLGQIHMNPADKLLHAGLAAVLLLAGLVFRDHRAEA
jgi:hypothetical protein